MSDVVLNLSFIRPSEISETVSRTQPVGHKALHHKLGMRMEIKSMNRDTQNRTERVFTLNK